MLPIIVADWAALVQLLLQTETARRVVAAFPDWLQDEVEHVSIYMDGKAALVVTEDVHDGVVSKVDRLHADVYGGRVVAVNLLRGDVHDGRVRNVNMLSGDVHGGEVSRISTLHGTIHDGTVKIVNVIVGDIRGGDVSWVNLVVGDIYGGRVKAHVHVGTVHGGEVELGQSAPRVRGPITESVDDPDELG